MIPASEIFSLKKFDFKYTLTALLTWTNRFKDYLFDCIMRIFKFSALLKSTIKLFVTYPTDKNKLVKCGMPETNKETKVAQENL